MSRTNQYNWGGRNEPRMAGPGSFDRDFGAMPRSPVEALEPSRGVQPPQRQQRREVKRRNKGSGGFMKLVNGVLTFVLMAMVAVGLLFFFIKVQFDQPGPLEYTTVISIPPGSGLNAIAARLQKEGVIADSRIFVGSAIYFKAQKKLKAGEYEFRKHASMRQVLDRLVEGKAILHKVTIREGITSQQIVDILNRQPLLSGEITSIPAEGSLLPDTYKFSRNMNRQDMIERMQAEQRKFVKKLWPKRASGLPIHSPEEAIILASIVERETGRADERARVAGVFINRLKRGMKLQSDPTIIYGLVGGQGSLGHPLRRSEIDRRTPYNTYQINGLPPTPIGNPGKAAIIAVLNPANTKDLFFVADGTGGHAFSPTLRGHRRNVAKWRKFERGLRARQAERRAAELAAASVASDAVDKRGDANSAAALGDSLNIPGLSLSNAPSSAPASGQISQVPVLTQRSLQHAGENAAASAAKPPAQAAKVVVRRGPKVPLPVRRPQL